MDSSGTVDVRRSGERPRTATDGVDSRHSFSFGAHYDPADTHFGLLVACNEETIRPGHGFDPHPHRDVEIVTWVLAGTLAHEDSAGHTGIARPGIAQRLSAGAGIVHAERNGGPTDVRFVQMWVVPDTAGVEPDYEQRDVGPELDAGGLVVIASGMPRHRPDRAVSIRQRDAALYAARLRPDRTVKLPGAPFVHVFVARGSVWLDGTGVLGIGDTARLGGTDGRRVIGGRDGAEVLVWEMHATLA